MNNITSTMGMTREYFEDLWEKAFTSKEIPTYPEFLLFIDPIAAQKEAWVCHKLMISHN